MLLAKLFEADHFDATQWLPLVLYGESGSGKSFVALSIADRWTSSAHDVAPVVTTAADLSRLFQPSKLATEMVTTTKLYRLTSLLVVDDVHLLVDRDHACSWLTGVLDYRARFDLPTIVTTTSMSTLSRLSKMLFSRLSAGLPISLSFPDRTTRQRIIQDLVKSIGSPRLSSIQIDSLADRSDGMSIVATRNLVLSSVSHQCPSLDDHRSPNSDDLPSRCMNVVAKRFGVRVADMKGPSRRKNTVLARSIAMFLIREFTSLSLVDTGQLFRNRDHSTIRHACQKIRKLLLTDTHIQDAVRSICSSLNLRYASHWSVSMDDKCA